MLCHFIPFSLQRRRRCCCCCCGGCVVWSKLAKTKTKQKGKENRATPCCIYGGMKKKRNFQTTTIGLGDSFIIIWLLDFVFVSKKNCCQFWHTHTHQIKSFTNNKLSFFVVCVLFVKNFQLFFLIDNTGFHKVFFLFVCWLSTFLMFFVFDSIVIYFYACIYCGYIIGQNTPANMNKNLILTTMTRTKKIKWR